MGNNSKCKHIRCYFYAQLYLKVWICIWLYREGMALVYVFQCGKGGIRAPRQAWSWGWGGRGRMGWRVGGGVRKPCLAQTGPTC